ncbi:guanine nucleotide-binding protein-like NSN1 isoform X2 [Salvia miltiorrhiza]|uniref:guanine nucleotide-binding protein-like NSN1 isoform X2 n=1 Tax=Salvia miltiorrhiza TaxID=226208 RepID=UPI0025AC5684|nr:guanine nucleotide-binding protein-like NSN1 isoform X2 [Salvia miltiorrhiza]
MPPKRNADEPSEARIVTELAKEFNIDEVYSSESSIIGSLKSVNDFNPVEVPSNSPLNFDMVMLEDKEPPHGNDDDQPMASGEEDGKVNAKEKSGSGVGPEVGENTYSAVAIGINIWVANDYVPMIRYAIAQRPVFSFSLKG